MKECEFYYADLDVTLVLKVDDENQFAMFTEKENLALQRMLYLTLSSFHICRALFLADSAERATDEGDKDEH